MDLSIIKVWIVAFNIVTCNVNLECVAYQNPMFIKNVLLFIWPIYYLLWFLI